MGYKFNNSFNLSSGGRPNYDFPLKMTRRVHVKVGSVYKGCVIRLTLNRRFAIILEICVT